jgi:DNA-binding transcriptional ArsR family regulator
MAEPRTPVRPKSSPRKPLPALHRIGKALSHPLRIRILLALMTRDGSAASLSEHFGDVSLGEVDYHLKVLAEECQAIDLTRVRRIRGAKEYIYRLKPWPQLAGGWLAVPRPVMGGFRGAAFARFIELAMSAAQSGTLEARGGNVFTGRPMALDHQGWTEIAELLQKAVDQVDAVETSSRERLEGGNPSDVIHAVVGLAAFETTSGP